MSKICCKMTKHLLLVYFWSIALLKEKLSQLLMIWTCSSVGGGKPSLCLFVRCAIRIGLEGPCRIDARVACCKPFVMRARERNQWRATIFVVQNELVRGGLLSPCRCAKPVLNDSSHAYNGQTCILQPDRGGEMQTLLSCSAQYIWADCVKDNVG